jgi:hypothetical protein
MTNHPKDSVLALLREAEYRLNSALLLLSKQSEFGSGDSMYELLQRKSSIKKSLKAVRQSIGELEGK